MTQTEFIDKLSACLTGKVSVGTVQENIVYYKQYFAEELSRGRSEEAVCASLGSPMLIAKGILEAEKFQNSSDPDYSQDVDEAKDFRSRGENGHRIQRVFISPAWLTGLISLLVFFVVINVVITVFSVLAPLILPICIVLFVVHIFKNNF